MANIALVTETLSHAAYTNTKTMLEGLGHTVTGYTSAAAVAATLATFDLIAVVRAADNATYADVVVAAFNMGVPVISGGNGGVTTGTSYVTNVPTRAGLVANMTSRDGQTQMNALQADPIFTAAGITAPGNFTVYTSSSFSDATLTTTNIATGATSLTERTTAAGEKTAIIALGGSNNLSNNPFPANIAFVGFFYGATGYSAQGTNFIREVINTLLSSGYLLSGTVRDSSNNPLARKVRAYLRSSGSLITEKTSNASTGAFEMKVYQNEPFTLVCLDADGGTKNALVKDRVIPVAL